MDIIQTEHNRNTNGPKGLIIILSVFVVTFIGISIALVIINSGQEEQKHYSEEINDLIGVNEQMVGWNGPIADSTKAVILARSITEKLNSNAEYSPNDAIAEYDKIYKIATDDLKCYIAIEYANYIYDSTQNLTRATEIIEQVEDSTLSQEAKINKLYTLENLYQKAHEDEKANYYLQTIKSLMPDEPLPFVIGGEKNE